MSVGNETFDTVEEQYFDPDQLSSSDLKEINDDYYEDDEKIFDKGLDEGGEEENREGGGTKEETTEMSGLEAKVIEELKTLSESLREARKGNFIGEINIHLLILFYVEQVL